MVSHMKTTIEISDTLFREAKQCASRERVTMRAIVEAALRQFLRGRAQRATKFKLRPVVFKGRGLQPGVDLTAWEQISDVIYKGRGS